MTDYGSTPSPEPERDGRWLADAIRAVQTPATFLQWYGVISMVLAALVVTVFLAAPDSVCRPMYDEMIKAQRDQPAEQRRPLPAYHKFVQTQQAEWVGGYAVSLVCSFFIALGGVKMRHLTGYGWAVTGSVLAAIPCTSSCCCAGLPIGLWAVVTLFGSDVRLGFARVGSAGGLEAFAEDESRDNPPSRPIRLE